MKIFKLLFTFLYLPIFLIAQWQPNGVVVCDTVGEQYLEVPDIVEDGQGGVYVIWGDHRNGWNIYMQHIDSSGYMLWERQGRPLCIKPSFQFAPYVVPDGEGGFVAAWHDYRNSIGDFSNDRDVYAQRIDKNGNKLWGEDDLEVIRGKYYRGVEGLINTSDSCFIFLWHDERNYPESGSIYVQKIDKEGKKLWDSTGVKASDDWGRQTRIVSDMNGGALIVWQNVEDKRRLYFQHVNRNGERRLGSRGKVIGYDTGGKDDLYIQACSDKRGGAIVSWVEWSTESDFDRNAYIQHVDSSGHRLWGRNGIYLGDSIRNSIYPKAMMLGEDSVVCITEIGGQTRLYLQVFDLAGHKKFSGAGKKLTNFWGISSDYSGISYKVYKNKFLYIAVQKFDAGSLPCVLKTDSNGKLYWDSSGVDLSQYKISVFQQIYLSVDHNGNAIIVWEDDRKEEAFPDIYAQKVYANGQISGDSSTSIKAFYPLKKAYQIASRIYPNPFNNSLSIEFKVFGKGEARIEIYNIRGQKLISFVRQVTPNQWERIIWDGKTRHGIGVSSGLYFVRIAFNNHHQIKKALFIK